MQGTILRRCTLLSVLIGFAALLPLIAFGLYALQVMSDRLLREKIEGLRQDVADDARQMTQVLDTVRNDLPILGRLPQVRELVRAKAAENLKAIEIAQGAVEQAMLIFSAHRNIYHQIRYIDERGQEVIRVQADGRLPARLIPRSDLQDKRTRDYFIEAMTRGPGEIYTSSVDLNQDHGRIEMPYRPVIRYAMALFDEGGNRRGIIIVNLLMNPLLEHLYESATAAKKVVYVLDQKGFYLLHPDPAKRWGGSRDLKTGERLQRDNPSLASRLLAGQAVAMIEGDQVIASQHLPLGSGASDPAIVLLETIPTHVVLTAIADLRFHLLIVLVGIGVLASAGAVFMGAKLSGPIGALEDAAHRIRQGDLDVRVQTGGSREIATLGEAFNAMTDGLTEARGQLTARIEELERMQSRATEAERLRDGSDGSGGRARLQQRPDEGPRVGSAHAANP